MLFQSSLSSIYENIGLRLQKVLDNAEEGEEFVAEVVADDEEEVADETQDDFFQHLAVFKSLIETRHADNSFDSKVYLFNTNEDNEKLYAHLTWLANSDDTSK